MQFFLYNIGNWRSQTGVHSTHAVAMERIWKWGHLSGIFFVVPLHFFGSKSTISRTGERFCDGQYGFVNFLFAVLLLAVPPPRHPVPAICKSAGTGGTCPPVPYGVGATRRLSARCRQLEAGRQSIETWTSIITNHRRQSCRSVKKTTSCTHELKAKQRHFEHETKSAVFRAVVAYNWQYISSIGHHG